MALTAAGFDGVIDEQGWAIMSALNGAQYAAAGATDFQVTPRTAATLTVNIAAGTAFGRGVTVTNTAQATIALDTISSGTRWDAIVIRRTWSTNTVTLEKITGTSVQQVPAGRNSNPGVVDDQVIALVQVTSGQTLPTAVLDMRVWPSKVLTVATLQAVTNPVIGMEAVVLGVGTLADTRWRYQLDPTNNPIWERATDAHAQRTITALSQSQVLATTVGWDAFALDNQAVIDGNHIDVWLEFRRESARLVSDANGATTAIAACTLAEELWPPKGLPAIPITYYGGVIGAPAATSVWPGTATLNSAGVFSIIGLTPNIYMNVRTGVAEISVRAHMNYTRRVPF